MPPLSWFFGMGMAFGGVVAVFTWLYVNEDPEVRRDVVLSLRDAGGVILSALALMWVLSGLFGCGPIDPGEDAGVQGDAGVTAPVPDASVPPECDRPVDCEGGETCIDGVCVRVECRLDEHCPAGMVCDPGDGECFEP